MIPWIKNTGGVLMLYLAVGFAAVEGWDVSKTYENGSINHKQEQAIEMNESSSDTNTLEISKIKMQLENMYQAEDLDLSVRSPGCRCLKSKNEGEQVWLMCPTKGPVCDEKNRTRCESENPGFDC